MFNIPITMNSRISDSSASGSTASAVISYRPWFWIFLLPTTIMMVVFAPDDANFVSRRPGMDKIDKMG